MRLYLSSYLWGNKPEKIVELIGKDKKHAALITNSADQFPDEGIVERMVQDQEFLNNMGITSERLDLRNYFGDKKTELPDKLNEFGFIWVRGANVFVLRRAMKQSGFDDLLIELLKNDKIAYGGYSAGACVLGSTLRGLDLVDDCKIAPEGYMTETIWEGLGALPYAVAPHYKSDHPESNMIDNAIEYFIENNIPYKALHDGEVIFTDGNTESVLS